ncbi:MAG: CCA tRNA nucleotidyltransferase, partial [Fimbriimonadaceae bacterium]|nr:CCA tRNA nucleotidyltransferase [Alphaproteobacteria bacterium]
VLESLGASKGKARIVGGAVRNALMDLPVADVDIATIWSPQEVVARLESAGLKAVATGLSHGTITAISDHKPFEITTLRVDVTGDGRHAEVVFTEDWQVDAMRRDFTINALYLNSDGSLYDPLGGYADIVARRVRFIGNADDRIAEDYLRVLRFFRFHAQFAAGDIDAAGLAACIRGRMGVRGLSAERMRAELLRLLTIEDCVGTVELFAQTGILTDILGGVAYVETLRNLANIERHNGWTADALLRLCVLGCKIREDAGRLAARLRLSKSEARRMTRAVDGYWKLSPALNDLARKELIYRLGAETYRDLVSVAWANAVAGPQSPDWADLHGLTAQWAPPVLPINAGMLHDRGVKPGKPVGEMLRKAETAWIHAGFPLSPKGIEKILDTVIAKT